MSRPRKQKLLNRAENALQLNKQVDLNTSPSQSIQNCHQKNNFYLDRSPTLASLQPLDDPQIKLLPTESTESSCDFGSTDWLLDPTSHLYKDDFFQQDVSSMLDGLNEPEYSLLGESFEPIQSNIETFQDLKFTSTPKSSRKSEDSGIGDSYNQSKRTKTEYKTILHDITDSHKFNTSLNDSFINIAHTVNDVSFNSSSKSLITPEKPPIVYNILQEAASTSLVSSVDQLNIPAIAKKGENACTLSNLQSSNEDDSLTFKEQLIYYSGISSYEKAVGLIKYVNIHKWSLSKYQVLLFTLMKLRLNLEWKDLAYRFESTEAEIIKIFQLTVAVLAESLVDIVPWQAKQNKNKRKKAKNFYVFIIRDSLSQIQIVIGSGNRPILYVSPLYSSAHAASSVLFLECKKHFIPGDVICFSNPFEHYSVCEDNNQLQFNLLPKDFYSDRKHPLDAKSRKVISNLELYALTQPSKFLPDEINAKAVFASCALTNLNMMPDFDLSVLNKIYERSECLSRSF